ncbi:hypothetical protein [Streptomyces afghaniensis]|uniref:hypothetical protein n=1 Tax=Streptomyces afghaniensis TaxID=66865 RepID=UPI0037A24EC5
MASSKHCIVISGDAVIGWALTSKARKEQLGEPVGKWYDQERVGVRPLEGGAWLLDNLIRQLAPADFHVASPDWGEHFEDTNFNKYHHYFVTIKEFEAQKGGAQEGAIQEGAIQEGAIQEGAIQEETAQEGTEVPDGTKSPDEKRGWRQIQIQGYSPRPKKCGGLNPLSPEEEHLDYEIVGDRDNPDIVVIEDAGVGYRGSHKAHCWPRSIEKDPRHIPWTIVEIGYGEGDSDDAGIAKGDLWKRIRSSKARLDRLIVVTTAEDLRYDPKIEISKSLSWERTAEDCVTAILSHPDLPGCRYVVVSFGPVGALLYDRDRGDFTLYFDRKGMEDASKFKQGGMWGFTTTLTAAIARKMMDHCLQRRSPVRIDAAVKAALEAMRAAYSKGYVESKTRSGLPAISFPTSTVKESIEHFEKYGWKGGIFGEASVPNPSRRPLEFGASKWSILGGLSENIQKVAESVVRYDVDMALPNVPVGEYGDLLTVDRKEIESFESIRNLVRGYRNGAAVTKPKPISIAVFGAPGSGKSYAVKQVVESLEFDHEFREFNLSQFGSVDDLWDALHVVRDDGLSGKFPIVFWDEFDSEYGGNLGWLRYFLYPMQDGKFRAGEVEHPIGQALFVFAGGTSDSLHSFERKPGFRNAKGPDFLSRIRGHINLLGTDPQGPNDPYYIIRRAILLRAWLADEKYKLMRDGYINIDDGVLNAFLRAPRYKHGVRSMQALVETSSLSRASHFGRSNLPSPGQLDLHVNAREFMSLVRADGHTLIPRRRGWSQGVKHVIRIFTSG